MWRHRAQCSHCDAACPWQGEQEEAKRHITRHVKEAHRLVAPQPGKDYQLARQRQCDYCLEAYLDHCTKCARDFCRLHAGDIDGLCGACI